MTKPPPNDDSEKPGKTRTWWHPLLARLLTYVLAGYCEVKDEIQVGKVPLRVDLLLIRLLGRRPTQRAEKCAHTLVGLLNQFTLIEFKGPTDSIERGDLLHFLACSLLWLDLQQERPPREKLSLLILAPSLNAAFRADARFLKCEIHRMSRGTYRVEGLPFQMWFVETNAVVDRNEPLLALVSDELLTERQRVIETLKHGHFDELLEYTVQQVTQFQSLGEVFAMRHAKTELLRDVAEDLRTAVLESFSAEERLRGLPAEERLRGLPAEERLRGLPAEEVIQALEPDQAKQLLELLTRGTRTPERHRVKEKRR